MSEFRREQIEAVFSEVMDLFEPCARDTLKKINYGKHIFETEIILKYSMSDSKILDIGGGVGVNLMNIRKLRKHCALSLIDRFEEYDSENRMGTVGNATQLMRDHNIDIIAKDFYGVPLPFESNHFDVITCFDVIEHLPGHPVSLLKEVRRILRHDGTFILGVPNGVRLGRLIEMIKGKNCPYTHVNRWSEEPFFGHYREYSRHEVRVIMGKAGLNCADLIMTMDDRLTQLKADFTLKQLMTPAGIRFLTAILIEYCCKNRRSAIYCIAKK